MPPVISCAIVPLLYHKTVCVSTLWTKCVDGFDNNASKPSKEKEHDDLLPYICHDC